MTIEMKKHIRKEFWTKLDKTGFSYTIKTVYGFNISTSCMYSNDADVSLINTCKNSAKTRAYAKLTELLKFHDMKKDYDNNKKFLNSKNVQETKVPGSISFARTVKAVKTSKAIYLEINNGPEKPDGFLIHYNNKSKTEAINFTKALKLLVDAFMENQDFKTLNLNTKNVKLKYKKGNGEDYIKLRFGKLKKKFTIPDYDKMGITQSEIQAVLNKILTEIFYFSGGAIAKNAVIKDVSSNVN